MVNERTNWRSALAGSIPTEIGQCSLLKELGLNCNQLTGSWHFVIVLIDGKRVYQSWRMRILCGQAQFRPRLDSSPSWDNSVHPWTNFRVRERPRSFSKWWTSLPIDGNAMAGSIPSLPSPKHDFVVLLVQVKPTSSKWWRPKFPAASSGSEALKKSTFFCCLPSIIHCSHVSSFTFLVYVMILVVLSHDTKP